ncbi:MAG: ABC transporter permease [Chloroflexi bacterium OLB15]|nr:MAG: ABC transporter permease [Chloroflexi bacterium OLB15]
MDRNNPAISANSRTALRWLIYLAPLVFLLLFFLFPLARIMVYSLAPEGALDLSGFAQILTSPYYLEIIGFTIVQAFISTALTLILALPCAYVFTRYKFPGKSLLLTLSTLPFVLPPVVVAAAFIALLGERGLVNDALTGLFGFSQPPLQLEQTLTLVFIAHTFYNYPVALRIITAYWANQNEHIEQSARVLGAHGWRLWWNVRLPMLRPALTAAALLVFIFCFTSFGIMLILGGQRYATIEVEIYRQAIGVFNLQAAAALSLLQIGFMLVLMFVYTRLQRRNAANTELKSAITVSHHPRGWREKSFVALNLLIMVSLLFIPLMALVVRAITFGGNGISFRYFEMLTTNPRGSVLFTAPINAIGNSLIFASLTAILALILGLIATWMINDKRTRFAAWLDPLLMLPLATSAVTLGFGYILALGQPPLNIRSSLALIWFAHTLVALPFVVRSALPAYGALPANVRESASVLGASPIQRFLKIDLPLMRRAIIVGITFAFTVSIGEFGASLFIARPESTTMPIVIYRLLGQPGAANYGQALAMSTLLLLVCAAALVIIGRFRTPGTAEF